jgi:hypothetical protein
LRFYTSQSRQHKGSAEIDDTSQSINCAFVCNIAIDWNVSLEIKNALTRFSSKQAHQYEWDYLEQLLPLVLIPNNI